MEGSRWNSGRGSWVGGRDGTEVKGGTGYTTGIGAGEVRSITGSMEGHIGGTDNNGVIWVGCGVRQEAVGGSDSGEGWTCLGGR